MIPVTKQGRGFSAPARNVLLAKALCCLGIEKGGRGGKCLIWPSRLGRVLRILLSVMCEITGFAMSFAMSTSYNTRVTKTNWHALQTGLFCLQASNSFKEEQQKSCSCMVQQRRSVFPAIRYAP